MTSSLLQRFRHLRPDPALRSAAGRLVRLWRPMAGWTLLVWAVVGAVLAPLSSALLGWSGLRGGETVVANEALLAWALSPPGLAWLILAGSLGLVGSVLHFAGVFRIVTDDLEGRRPSLASTALGLLPRTPALLRLSAAAVGAGLVAALPLAGGLAGVHRLLLAGQDINYFLAERPAAWWWALGTAGAWTAAWAAGVAWLAGRSVLALPAYLDGHRGLAAAVRRSWRGTRGEGGRVVRVVGLAVAAWLAVRALVNAAAVAAGTAVVGWTASVSDSLGVLLAATGGWAVVSLVLDAAVAFLGIAWISTVLTKLYHEDTALHAAVDVPSSEAAIPARLRAVAQRWLRPRRLAPTLAVALAVSTATGAVLLERVPEPRPVAVTAHRAGPPPAPENTLAALEAAVDAGADWSEVDVQLTRDGVPVLVHDADLLRVAGDRRRVSEVTYREIRDLLQGRDRRIPAEERRVVTLGEFLDRAEGRIGVVVELKYYGWDPELAREVARVLRGREADDRVMVMSLELRGVRQFREAAPEVPVGWAAAAAVGSPARLDVDFLSLSRSAASPAVLDAAREAGVGVHVWTLNRADVIAEAIQDGADGIITDRPGLAVEVRDELADLPAVSRLLLRFGHLLIEGPDGGTAAEDL